MTRPPNPPFVPASPYKPAVSGQFFVGSDELWAVVPGVNWRVGVSGTKLPYFRRGYNYMAEQAPDLQLTARRLDAPAALVTGGRASGGMVRNDSGDNFMVTNISIPAEGCWEITTRYRDQTLTYTVNVER